MKAEMSREIHDAPLSTSPARVKTRVTRRPIRRRREFLPGLESRLKRRCGLAFWPWSFIDGLLVHLDHLREHDLDAVALCDHLFGHAPQRAERAGIAKRLHGLVGNAFDIEQV